MPVVIVVIGWLLSERYFPAYTFGYEPIVNYLLGGAASILLTFSILFHELGHAFTAVRSKLSIERIHLFLFGGMAELKHRPVVPYQELLIAISGPLASLLLAGIIYLFLSFFPFEGTLISLVLTFLVQINVLLALFNLIPIFPLDGGRAIRAFFWYISGYYQKASRATLILSYILVVTIFLAGVADLIWWNSGYQLVLLLLSLYMGYTVLKGKNELIHQPNLQELIFTVDPNPTPVSIVRHIMETNQRFLPRTLIPVLEGASIVSIVNGSHLHNAMVFDNLDILEVSEDYLESYFLDVHPGDYIEITEQMSFDPDVRFNADFIPVLEAGRFLGLCDANELRFWLLEHIAVNGSGNKYPDILDHDTPNS